MNEEKKTNNDKDNGGRKTFNLFTYGTLNKQFGMGRRLHDLGLLKGGVPGVTAGKIYVTSNGYPAADFSHPGTIRGTVFRDLPKKVSVNGKNTDILAVIDHYEAADCGAESLYQHSTVTVKTEDGEVEALAYEATDILREGFGKEVPDGDWAAFAMKPCGHLKEKNTKCGTYLECDLTGASCPFVDIYANGKAKGRFGLCCLPDYAATHPEKNVDNGTLGLLATFFGGCMRCDMLAKHYYLSDCCRDSGTCSRSSSQLKLRYLAHCWEKKHEDKQEGKERK